ncbi:2312_t:CDS:10, partial [Cetraspora pellucida]
SLQEWFNAAVNEKEFDEIRYDDLKELVLIGRGAFGEVYSANCVSTNNTVAVKKPVYSPPSQMPVNSGSLNTLLSSISSGNNPTLIFDENLAVPLKLNDEIPPDYGTCKCGHKFTDVEWCNECESENFRRNFNSWTSGDQRLDELIKESQLKATHVSDYIEWIEHDQLKDIERIGQGGFSTVSSAIWCDGPREEWDEETGQWERAFNTKVAIKYLVTSELDASIVLNEAKLYVCCDKIIRLYGITRDNVTDTYGLIQKFASYGSLRSFIKGRPFIGWWQKLKILEGIIQDLSQIHLKAGYCHRDLHPGNVLIDQDELSVSVLSAYIIDFGNEDQFNSADRKVRGLKRRPKKMEIQSINTSKILEIIKDQDVKHRSTEYKFAKENLLVKNLLISVSSYTPAARAGHTAVLIGNKLYFLGGQVKIGQGTNEFSYLDLSVPFDTATGQLPWTDLTNISSSVPAHYEGLAVLSGDKLVLYSGVVGSSLAGGPLIYIFDTQKQLWSVPFITGTVPSRRKTATAVIDTSGKMYMFGGSMDSSTGSSVFAFSNELDILDTVGLSWSMGTTTNSPSGRDTHSATLLSNGIIVFIGGHDTADFVSMSELPLYDTKLSVWSSMNTSGNIPDKRVGHTAVLVSDGRIIIYSGWNWANNLQPMPIVAILNVTVTPFQWSAPTVYNTPPRILMTHTATLAGNYMIVAFGKDPHDVYNSDITIMDIRNYTWLTAFTPNSIMLVNPTITLVSSGINAGLLVGLLIGAIGFVTTVIVTAFMVYRWNKRRKYRHAIPTA